MVIDRVTKQMRVKLVRVEKLDTYGNWVRVKTLETDN